MAYQVLKSSKASAQLKTLSQKYDRMNEMEKAITWFLEKSPLSNRTVDLQKANCRLWTTEELASHLPVVRIVYQVDNLDRVVTIISIEENTKINPLTQ